jgi:hypothetical protein
VKTDPPSSVESPMRTLASLLLPRLLAAPLTGCVLRRVVEVPPDLQGQLGEDPPPGMVELNVQSEDGSQVWDVRVGHQPVCTTPCTQVVPSTQYVELDSRDGEHLNLAALGVEAPGAKRVLVAAEGTQTGKQVNGIVFTTLGAMGVVVAITLAAVGCSDTERHGGMCTAGLITGAVTAPLTAVAIWMIADSGPRAHVLPVVVLPAAKGQTPVSLALTPTGVVGTF